MADPLRRTLLAKLRGKRSKKGAALDSEGREGKEKVLQRDQTDRMSSYDNSVEAGAVLLLREPGQRDGGLEQGAGCADAVPGAPRRRFLAAPHCSLGDSIGFGAPLEPPHEKPSEEGLVTISDADVIIRGHTRHISVKVHNWTFNNRTLEIPASHVEENSLIRNLGSYRLDEEVRAGGLQSPTFFPTELEICDVNVTSLGPSTPAVRYPLDSEEDDYYDNEILPFYEALKGEDREVQQSETDRLRNQLKEAYYLLIHAMNDISLDVQQQISGALTERRSSCSSHSRDSLCSRSSAKNMDSDSWSSGGDHSPQQVSDTESLLLCLVDAFESGAKLRSKSMVELSAEKLGPLLHRSASDGATKYLSRPLVSVKGADERETGLYSVEQADPAVLVSSSSEKHNSADDEVRGPLHESSGSVNSLSGSSDSNAEGPTQQSGGNKQELRSFRALGAHGVTVNKMQEWMHKGRLLSSEMKQRIEGSPSIRAGGLNPERPVSSSVGARPLVPTPGVKAKSPRQPQQPAFIENFQTRESGRSDELQTWRPHLNTITVSKKRNWLQQSSLGRNQCTKEEQQDTLGAEEESCQNPPPSASPSPEHFRSSGEGSLRSARQHLLQVNMGQTKVFPHPTNMDPAEENDADDEGEIWYNPIPEDDEHDTSLRPSISLLVPTRVDPQRRPSKVGVDASHCGRTLENSGEAGSELPGESLNMVSENGNQGNAAHSTDTPSLHRRTLACKAQEELGLLMNRSIVPDVPDLPNMVGFSPPSSPNPAKKSSSINWSFPDKIKSPRTVRKISMKMKKLPELSRKLSVKGTQSSSSHPEPRTNPLRSTGTGPVPQTSGPQRLPSSGGGQASRNVISRYHLDSSVSTQHSFSKKKNNGSSKSACKGGYLSDGDSPELVAKSGKHGSSDPKRAKEMDASKLNSTELDIDAFRHYSFGDQPKCSQYISGLMSLHFYGAEDLKPPRVDSRDVYCAIQVDSVNKARTALLTCRTAFLDMDHTFNIELENAQHLKLVVFSWEPTPRKNKVCCHGTVVLPALFRVTRSHQLAVKLEPRGLIYVKLSLMEQWQNSLDGGPGGDREPQVFGVEAWRVVEREESGLMVPLLISKCITEIENRGCQVVGLYRLCGSAAVKKELREAFERDSDGVELDENTYPDVNVITGVLKDYLRELPYPLITKHLYEAVLDSMASRPLRIGAAGCENDQADSEHTVSLLDHLPEVERVTLRMLLDHLKLVASHQDANKMTCQNLAVCFGPVLLSQRQEASCHSNRVFIDSEELASALHFKKHIEVLHYLLQLWPVVDPHARTSVASSPPPPSDLLSAPPLRRRKERPQVLNLTDAEMAGVLRPKPGRLDSPSNRYAGDWSGCGENYFPCEMLLPTRTGEADYDDVASEDPQTEHRPGEEEPDEEQNQNEEVQEEEKQEESDSSGDRPTVEEDEEPVCEHILPPSLSREHTYQAYVKIQDISPVLSNRVNLRDLQESIDTLIGNLERELNKNKLNVGY